MKIFLDTANIEEIREAVSWGIVRGVTTNPTLMNRAKADYATSIKEICEIVKGPVSAEVLARDSEGMVKEAQKLSEIDKHVNVKIPISIEGLKAIKELSALGIKTNCTLIFSANQALLAASAGATYVSPFIGRLDDTGNDGMEVVADIVQILENYDFKTEVIAASIRHPMHVLEAAMLGADIATVPFAVLQKMVQHPLTDKGIKLFLEDAKKAGLKI
ncbi:MAG: fructose-6-phosphate aldolase [Candidatus Diapherotrites archaeon]|nr:fructose-6-phosphate aldolase [Candidatus Diapherotrites archaeon]